MNIDAFSSLFAGIGGTIAGGLVGAWATARFGFGFQKKLLAEQLAFQERLLKQQLDFEKVLAEQSEKEMRSRHDQSIKTLTYLRDTLNTRFAQSGGELSSIDASLQVLSGRKSPEKCQ
jgi:hypothetical protein